MWIKVPTPATTRAIAADSGSASRRNGMTTGPAVIHRYTSTSTLRDAAGSAARAWNSATAAANDAATVAEANHPAARAGHRPPHRPSTAQPASGSSGIKTAAAVTRFIRGARPRRRRPGLTGPEHVHDDREADHDLGRGHHQHEEDEHLPVDGAVKPRERDQREVDRVEHQLDRHEDDERGAAHQHARGAHGEQHRAQPEIVRRGNAHVRGPRRRPSATAPIMPASSTSDAASNGSRYRPNSARPTSWMVPNEDAGEAAGGYARATRSMRPAASSAHSATTSGTPAGPVKAPPPRYSPLSPSSMMMKTNNTTIAPA